MERNMGGIIIIGYGELTRKQIMLGIISQCDDSDFG